MGRINDKLGITFEIVGTDEKSVRQIMDWRNDTLTRQQSFHQEPKQWPRFYNEYLSDYCNDPSLPCLFVLQDNVRVGFLRFRRIDHPQARQLKTCDISINMAPEHRGRGLGAAAVSQVLSWLRQAGIQIVLSEVKIDNESSIRMFESAGFSQLDQIDHVVADTGEKVTVIRLLAVLTSNVYMSEHKRAIGPGEPCFIIAEAGSNWRMGTRARDLKMARALIDVAAEAGADAVKFQTYRPESTYVSNAGESDYLSDVGIKESITSIFEDLAMPYEMVPELAQYCKEKKIIFMSSPFSGADFNAIDPFTPIHKIASYEISHSRLIEHAAQSGKPLILSTGASDLNDIRWAVDHFRSLSTANVCLMQCTAKYPAPLSSLNLGTIPLLQSLFGVPVGLSDHSQDAIIGPSAAVALGANLIEKHFTLDKRLPGPDHAFAITPEELKAMVLAIRQTEQVVGSGVKNVLPEESELYYYARRGLQAIAEIGVGDQFYEGKNIDILRPGKQRRGIHPKHLDRVLAGRATRKINLGDGIQESDFQ